MSDNIDNLNERINNKEDVAYEIARLLRPFIKRINRGDGIPEFRKTVTGEEAQELFENLHYLSIVVVKSEKVCS